ncbi:transcriptional regulator [Campylobacter upsaliensis]|uniref:transcriptional regulator n=1 Tax=Campylobacter upsaliensis TaxID=28080 RepID=UPI00214A00E0|nr:transcriptional regulator [Campylobacter upsaliensis]MCR2104892.1 transcriptional regulator [Campylobacter upsaliensis]
MTDPKENLIKATCKEQKLTYKQLGELIGYSEATLNKNASTNEISKPVQRAIELYLETLVLKKKLEEYHTLKNSLKELISQILKENT